MFVRELNEEDLQKAAALFSAMADPARLRLLLLLHFEGELCVTDLANTMSEKANTVSVRLKKLAEAKLVSKRRDAKHIYYRLGDSHVVTMLSNAIEHIGHD